MSHALPPEILDQIADRFRVLAEPTRLRILNVLLEGERTVSDLVDETGLNQANVSKHLGVLRSSNFVDRRKEGLYAFYSVADPSVGVLCEIMCGRLEAQAAEQSALLGTVE
jgi:ArsR family transcriptional regulator